jgi:hypothetical protein
MIERQVIIDGVTWTASLAGRFTVYERDEFPVVFERRDVEGRREQRVARFSPLGARSRAQALAELTDAELVTLFRQSAPAATSPELGYARS